MKSSKSYRSGSWAALFVAVAFIGTGCNDASTAKTETDTAAVAVEESWVIDEHQINQVPLTTMAKVPSAKNISHKHAKASNNAGKPTAKLPDTVVAVAPETDADAYDVASMMEFDSMLNAQDYVVTDTITATEAIVPLDETQTAFSYSKKGKDEGELQVVSDADGNVEQVVFTNKKHHDVYNVNVGMSGRDVKKLRREMKHMVKKGKVFLYSDDSNVMYMMDAKDTQGNEVTAAAVDDMSVQAVIWKDKKHREKDS
jgi:hypothetical protein